MAVVEPVLFLIAAPLVLLMGVWAAVGAYRILMPDAAFPVDRTAPAHRLGTATPVRVRDIVAEQRRRPAPAFPLDAPSACETESVAEALWARRN